MSTEYEIIKNREAQEITNYLARAGFYKLDLLEVGLSSDYLPYDRLFVDLFSDETEFQYLNTWFSLFTGQPDQVGPKVLKTHRCCRCCVLIMRF